MSALNLFETISRGTYKPQLNAVGVNDKGQFVDANNNVTTLYSQPSWFQRAFNPNADAIQQMNLEGGGAYLSAEQHQNIANRLAAENWAKVRDAGLYPSQFKTLDPTVGALAFDGRLSPGIAGSEGAHVTENQLGMPVITGQANTVAEQNRLSGNLATQQFQLPTKDALLHDSDFHLNYGIDNAKLAALPNNAKAMLNQSAIDAATTGQGVTDIPVNTGTQRLTDIANNYLSQYIPDRLVGESYVSSVSPYGVTPSGGMLNPAYKPQFMTDMASMQRGMAGGNATTTSGGRTFAKPVVTPTAISPIVGTAYQPDISEQVKEQQKNEQEIKKAQHEAIKSNIDLQQQQLETQKKQLEVAHKMSAHEAGQYYRNTIGGGFSQFSPEGLRLAADYWNNAGNNYINRPLLNAGRSLYDFAGGLIGQ